MTDPLIQTSPLEPPHETPPEEPFISDIPGVTPVDKPHDPPIADPIVPDIVADADSLLFV